MRDENVSRRRAHVVIVRLHGDVGPILEVVRAVFGIDGAHLSFVEKRQRAAHRSDLHRLKDAIEDEDMTVEHDSYTPTPAAAGNVSTLDRSAADRWHDNRKANAPKVAKTRHLHHS